MKESDYIKATNIAKMRIAKDIMADCLFEKDLQIDQFRIIKHMNAMIEILTEDNLVTEE